MKKIWLVALSLVFFSSCQTAPVAPQPEQPRGVVIDYLALQSNLGIRSGAERVGFQEKIFDACAYRSLLPPMKDCRHAYFSFVQFQISCRGSEESNSVLSAADLRPVKNKVLKWRAGKNYGQILSDQGGYAEIRAISEKSLKRQQLRVSTGTDFMVLSAGQSTNIVTPPSWCQ